MGKIWYLWTGWMALRRECQVGIRDDSTECSTAPNCNDVPSLGHSLIKPVHVHVVRGRRHGPNARLGLPSDIKPSVLVESHMGMRCRLSIGNIVCATRTCRMSCSCKRKCHGKICKGRYRRSLAARLGRGSNPHGTGEGIRIGAVGDQIEPGSIVNHVKVR